MNEILARWHLRSLGADSEEPDHTLRQDDPIGQGHRPAHAAEPYYLTKPLADVVPSDVQWLWLNYVVLGALTELGGDPDLGKSTIAADLAARVTTGKPMPDGTRSDIDGCADVIVASAEDDPSKTILPRVRAAGGNHKRVHFMCEVPNQSGTSASEEQWSTPKHAAYLKKEIIRLGAKLVILDPLASFLTPGYRLNQEQDMRTALDALARIAKETGCAILLLRHLNKSGGKNAIYRGGGSIAVVALARVALLVAVDPEDPTERRCVLAVTKSNLAPHAPSIGYRIVSAGTSRTSRIRWGQQVQYRANDLLKDPVSEAERSQSAQIADFLGRATERDAILVAEGRAMVAAAGFSVGEKTIQRAARLAGLKPRLTTDFPARWYWARDDQELPSVDTAARVHESPDGVPTGPIRENSDSAASVDRPLELSTLANGKVRNLTEEDLR